MDKENLTPLVIRFRQGDKAAFGELYEATYHKVYFYALKQVKNPMDAEDITQSTFVEVCKSIGGLSDPACFSSWIITICHRLCCKHFRTTDFTTVSVDDEESFTEDLPDDDTATLPEELLDSGEFQRVVDEMISSLPATQRACLLMYYFEEMSIGEIAEALEIPEGTVKSNLNYARKKLRHCVEEYEKKNHIQLHSVAVLPLLLLLQNGTPCTPAPLDTILSAASEAASSLGHAETAATAGKAMRASRGIGKALSKLFPTVGKKVAAAAVAATILAGGIFGAVKLTSAPKPLDLRSFVDLHYEGVNEHGVLDEMTFQNERFTEALSRYSGLPADDADIRSLVNSIAVTCSETADLSNGDTVTVTVAYREQAAQTMGVAFVNTVFSLPIEGLPDTFAIDPFKGVTAEFIGVIPLVDVVIHTPEKPDYYHDFFGYRVQYPSDNTFLTVGGTVAVEAEIQKSDLAERRLTIDETTCQKIAETDRTVTVTREYPVTAPLAGDFYLRTFDDLSPENENELNAFFDKSAEEVDRENILDAGFGTDGVSFLFGDHKIDRIQQVDRFIVNNQKVPRQTNIERGINSVVYVYRYDMTLYDKWSGTRTATAYAAFVLKNVSIQKGKIDSSYSFRLGGIQFYSEYTKEETRDRISAKTEIDHLAYTG